jgi:siroheme synthase (precorrin-2 oxidase/ferrochelatase)
MSDLQVRTEIQELTEPIMNNMHEVKKRMDVEFVAAFKDIEKRMVLLEQTVFRADGPEFRFEKLEKAQLEISVDVKTHYEFHKD